MTRTRRPLQSAALLVATLFGVGRFPFAPGTAGTLAALPAVVAAALYLSSWEFAIAALGVAMLAIWAAGVAARQLGQTDPRAVVIDEAAGLMVALLGLPMQAGTVIGACLLFRAFDVLKPPPAGAAERLSGGLGIVADDLIAGAYANLAVRAVRFLYETMAG